MKNTELRKLIIEHRIALLNSRQKPNATIVRKLQRELRKIEG